MADDKTYTQEELDAVVKGLKDKNGDLLGQIASFKTTIAKFDGIDIEQLTKDSSTLKSMLENQDKEKGEYKKLYEDLKTATDTKIADLEGKIKEKDTEFNSHKKRSKISSGLAGADIDPIMLDIAVDAIIGKAAMDDNGTILIDGKPQDEFIADWVKTDLGKKFTIDGNTGGGGGGGEEGGDSQGVAKFFDKKSEHYNLTEQAKLAKTNIAEYNRLRKIYG